MTQTPEGKFGPPAKDLKDRPSRARYEKVREALEPKWRRRRPEADRMMVDVVEALWDSFADHPYAGCGFWILALDRASASPGHHRGEMRASGSGLSAAAVQAVASGHAAIATAEGVERIAVPVFDRDQQLWGVLEAVAARPDAFDEMDQRWLERIVKVFQLAKKVGGGP